MVKCVGFLHPYCSPVVFTIELLYLIIKITCVPLLSGLVSFINVTIISLRSEDAVKKKGEECKEQKTKQGTYEYL